MVVNMLSNNVYSFFFDEIRSSKKFGMIFAERERERERDYLARAKDKKYFPKFIYSHNIFFQCCGFFMSYFLILPECL